VLNNFFNFLIKKSIWSLGILLLVVGVLISQIQHFSLDASEESLSLDGDKNLTLYNKTEEIFGTNEPLIISYTSDKGLINTENLIRLRAFRDDLLTIDQVHSVVSILDVSLFQSPPLSLGELAGDIITIDNGKADLALVADEFATSPLYAKNLMSEDGKTTALLINLSNPLLSDNAASTKEAIAALRLTMDKYRNDAQLHLGGIPMIRNDVMAYIAKDLVVFSLAVVALMSLILAIIFRKIRWVLIPIGVSVTAALSMTGLLGILGWKVTVISTNFFSLSLVMTLSVSIHLVVRYRELALASPNAELADLLKQTLRQMLTPCVLTTLTTIAAFASLIVSHIQPVIDFGWMMAIGVCIALILSFVSFAVLMILLPKATIKSKNRNLFLSHKLAVFTDKYGNQLIIGLVFLVIIAMSGVKELTVENRFIDYFKSSSEIHQGLNHIDKQLGGTMALDIIFDDLANNYWVDPMLQEDIHRVHKYLESLDATGKVMSIDSMMQILTKANNDKPPSGFLLMIGKNHMSEFAKSQILDPHLSESADQLRVVSRIKETDKSLNRVKLIDNIKTELVDTYGFKPDSFHLTGTFVLYNNLLQSLFDSQIKTIAVVFGVIFVMFILVLKSLSLSLLALIPNTLPAMFILGIMGLTNIPLDLMTITIAAIAIGIGVDNAIHYIHRFKAEFKIDQDYLATMYRSHASIGLAMFYTSITIAIGFLVLALSNFVPNIYFGIFTAIAMLSAMLANLTLLPKLLLIFKPKMGK